MRPAGSTGTGTAPRRKQAVSVLCHVGKFQGLSLIGGGGGGGGMDNLFDLSRLSLTCPCTWPIDFKP